MPFLKYKDNDLGLRPSPYLKIECKILYYDKMVCKTLVRRTNVAEVVIFIIDAVHNIVSY